MLNKKLIPEFNTDKFDAINFFSNHIPVKDSSCFSISENGMYIKRKDILNILDLFNEAYDYKEENIKLYHALLEYPSYDQYQNIYIVSGVKTDIESISKEIDEDDVFACDTGYAKQLIHKSIIFHLDTSINSNDFGAMIIFEDSIIEAIKNIKFYHDERGHYIKDAKIDSKTNLIYFSILDSFVNKITIGVYSKLPESKRTILYCNDLMFSFTITEFEDTDYQVNFYLTSEMILNYASMFKLIQKILNMNSDMISKFIYQYLCLAIAYNRADIESDISLDAYNGIELAKKLIIMVMNEDFLAIPRNLDKQFILIKKFRELYDDLTIPNNNKVVNLFRRN